jgi:Flp pilus assembly secretin CpaC
MRTVILDRPSFCCAAVIAVALLAAGTAVSQEQAQVQVPIGGARDVTLSQPASTMMVATEGILRAEPMPGSNRNFRLVGLRNGVTMLTAQNERGDVFYTAIVTVGRPERAVMIIRAGKASAPHTEHAYRCTDMGCRHGDVPDPISSAGTLE